MKNILTQWNKILLGLCALSVVFFAAMLLWHFLIPVERYEQTLETTWSQASAAQVELDQRIASAQSAVTEATAQQEELNQQIAQLQNEMAITAENMTALQAEIQNIESLPETILQVRQEYGEKIRQLEEMVMNGETDLRICYLTFDDGPNNLTASIINKLAEHDVYATFFTIGANSAAKQTQNLRAEMMAGHTVANHTYSHAIFGALYKSFDEFTKQIMKQDENVFTATGFHTDIFRFPSGSSICRFMDEAEAWMAENGFKWIDWNASAWDAGNHALNASASKIYSNMWTTSKNKDIVVILCHDFNRGTYGALDLYIPKMHEEGYVFLPLLPQSHMFDEPLPVI